MSRPKGSSGNPAIVLKALTELGPMTNRELVEETGISSQTMGVVLFVLREKPKRMIRITGWIDLPYNGVNTRPLAQYGIGTNADAPKPPPLGHTAVSRRIRAQKRIRVNSVFNIGANNVNTLFAPTPHPTDESFSTNALPARPARSPSRRRPLQKAADSTNAVQHDERTGCVPAHDH